MIGIFKHKVKQKTKNHSTFEGYPHYEREAPILLKQEFTLEKAEDIKANISNKYKYKFEEPKEDLLRILKMEILESKYKTFEIKTL